ncbi:PucR family transcriptional regulator [Streptomyces beijiangensis]|uniref:Helix-turn-helix domain-containing protein n=1 Tax=Streptomyces beijiangensis TaxID=163361 RepID=A0A939F3S5_9ACTN|nr:helix-turn-helix domain-containing protein [Streptomyces beijiangensis]MBO0512016.1 helix-turn-helix domain-containing protein [Streptomyces beijiangensis]
MPPVLRSRVRTLYEVPAVAPLARGSRSLLDAEAVAVLHRAARILLDDLPAMTDRLVAALREQEPAYRAAIASHPAEVWQEVQRSLRHSVVSLLEPRETREAAHRTSAQIAELRAERGLPLDALLHAFRLGGAMVWQGLVEETSRDSPEDMRLLIHVATDVWNFVDEHCGVVAEAYRRTERRMAWQHENRLRLLTAGLFDGSARLTDVPDAADALGLPQEGWYAVIALAGDDARPRLPAGTRTLRHSGSGTQYVLVLLGDAESAPAELAALAATLALPPGARAGIGSPVEGLAAVPEARRLADTALRACPRSGGTVLLDERLPDALVVSSPELAEALAERVLGPLRALDPADRDLLLDTLTVWLETDGSAPRAGARLYCHRNTVLNRLRRFEQLTGRSLTRVGDMVEVALALGARRLLGD